MNGKSLCLLCLLVTLTLHSANAAPEGLSNHWPFDGDLVDIVGAAAATFNGGNPAFVGARAGQGLQLDGQDDFVHLALVPDPEVYTITLWVMVERTDNANIIVRTSASGGTTHWSHQMRIQDGVFHHYIWVGARRHLPGTTQVEPNTWYHVAIVGQNNGPMRLYVNGVEDAASIDTAGTLWSEGDRYYLGSNTGDGMGFLQGVVDDLQIYDRELSAEEILLTMALSPEKAKDPNPMHESVDVPRDLVLAWTPGEFAVKHDVYLGTSFDDVNDADRADTLGVQISQDQDASSIDPGRLAFNTLYFWRVDEVNGAPDFTVFKGDVWNFTTEPIAYPLTPMAATASSAHIPAMGPEKTIDGSGLNAADQHNVSGEAMWLTSGSDTERWIQYEFAKPQKLHELWVWNSNQAIESFIGFGAKDVTIETSIDGTTWPTLADVPEFAQAPGSPDYTYNTVVDFGGVTARYVRLTINTGWGMLPQFGLSEVRFFAVPVYARQPDPTAGTANLPTEVELRWRAGREAATHGVYLGTDPNALLLVGQTTDTRFAVSVDLDQTHHWRINEINDVTDPSVWEGDVWHFSTALFTVIDDMESYRDAEFEEIWATWTDGFEDPDNGALVGNGATGAPETGTVYDGLQSMPYHYGQGGANVSVTTRVFDQAMDWSKNGVRSLSLMFYGDPGNTAGQLYIGINGNRVVDYPGAPDDTTQPQWHAWQVDLVALGITTVQSLTLGVQGGTGTLFVDALRLYPTDAVLLTPVAPDDTGLVAYYPLNDNTQDLSGQGHDGAAVGDPLYVAGPAGLGSGLKFDGSGSQYVDLGTWNPSAATGQLTLSLWTQWTGISGQWQGLIGKRDAWSESGMMWDLEAHRDTGVMRFGRNGSTVGSGLTLIEQGEWEPWAVTFDGSMATLFRHGLAVASGELSFGSKTDANMQLGAGQMTGGNPYNGALSEVRLYDRVLSPAEVAGLVGRTAPFYQP